MANDPQQYQSIRMSAASKACQQLAKQLLKQRQLNHSTVIATIQSKLLVTWVLLEEKNA
jgi:hypothetical protein